MSIELDVRARIKDVMKTADPAHDLSHLDRVAGMAKKLTKEEGGELEIILVAVYLHDIHRAIEQKEKKDHVSTDEAWSVIERFLSGLDIGRSSQFRVRRIIEQTSEYSFGQGLSDDWSIESAIVHDADNLDALGAIGIARAFAYGGAKDEPFWDPQSLPSEGYSPGKTSSVVAHFYEKLLRLQSDMLTATGEAIAVRRTRVIKIFLLELFGEWEEAIDDCCIYADEWRCRIEGFHRSGE